MKDKHFADELVNGLKDLTTKLEQLQLDAALGKAEAKEKMREYQEELKEFARKVDQAVSSDNGVIGKIKGALQSLEVQAHLGEADLKDFLKEQKKNMDATINKINDFIKKEWH